MAVEVEIEAAVEAEADVVQQRPVPLLPAEAALVQAEAELAQDWQLGLWLMIAQFFKQKLT
jgi:hypothetical protein